MARYRWRTKLRTLLPWSLVGLAPKGRDCGDHEWYRKHESTWGCVHCTVTTDGNPWSPLEASLLEALGLTKRLELAAMSAASPAASPASGMPAAELYRRLEESLRAAEAAASTLPEHEFNLRV